MATSGIGADEIKNICDHGEGEIVKKLEPDEKVVYSHDSRKRCGECSSQKVFSVGTRWEGMQKRWKCKTCGYMFKTIGEKI